MSYSPPDSMNSATKTTGDPMPTPTAIPDLVRIGTIPTNTAISIDTDILDPVVNTDSFCRFQFQNKGILHSHSKITLRFDKQANRAFAPINVGIHSVVERCRLLVGTKTISEIDDFNHYMAYKSAFMSNEHQKEREQVTSDRMIAHEVYYDNGSNVSGAGQSNTSASFIGLDTGMNVSFTASGEVGSTQSDLVARPYQVTNSAFGGPEYQIALADLFPFLYSNQLPLYMMTEPVTVEITFAAPAKRRLCVTSGVSAELFKFDLTATKLVADYQYFPQEIMEQYAAANRDMTFSYVDYRLAKRTVSVNEAAGSEKAIPQQIMNIGAAGRICSKVVALLSNDQTAPEATLLNLYNSAGAPSDYASISNVRSNGTTTTNIKYNNVFLYPVDIDNPCRHFYQVTQAEGMVPFVTRDEYSDAGNLLTPTTFEGGEQNKVEGLKNNFFIQSYHLNRAERINSRGIEYYFQYSKLANRQGVSTDSYTMRTYVELLKTATLRDGVMETFFS